MALNFENALRNAKTEHELQTAQEHETRRKQRLHDDGSRLFFRKNTRRGRTLSSLYQHARLNSQVLRRAFFLSV